MPINYVAPEMTIEEVLRVAEQLDEQERIQRLQRLEQLEVNDAEIASAMQKANDDEEEQEAKKNQNRIP